MNIPMDIVLASNAASLLGVMVVVPQLRLSWKNPASLDGLSGWSLAIQALSLAGFLYANVRLTLWGPSAQCAGALVTVLVVCALKAMRASSSGRQPAPLGLVPAEAPGEPAQEMAGAA